jgi:hypothetical protein
MKSKKQRKQQPKSSKRTDIGDGEDAAEHPNVQDNGGEQQQENDQPPKIDEVGCFFRSFKIICTVPDTCRQMTMMEKGIPGSK